MMSDRIFSVALKTSSSSIPLCAVAEPLRPPPEAPLPAEKEDFEDMTGFFKSTRSHILAQGLEVDSSIEADTPLRNVSSCSRLRACLRATFEVGHGKGGQRAYAFATFVKFRAALRSGRKRVQTIFGHRRFGGRDQQRQTSYNTRQRRQKRGRQQAISFRPHPCTRISMITSSVRSS